MRNLQYFIASIYILFRYTAKMLTVGKHDDVIFQ